jgi:hypothetical protein
MIRGQPTKTNNQDRRPFQITTTTATSFSKAHRSISTNTGTAIRRRIGPPPAVRVRWPNRLHAVYVPYYGLNQVVDRIHCGPPVGDRVCLMFFTPSFNLLWGFQIYTCCPVLFMFDSKREI